MKFIMLLLILLSPVVEARNIVLLTSLPEKQLRTSLRLEKIFHKKTQDFAEDYKIIVKHEADQELLHRYLNDPETHALFWVSHGGYMKSDPSSAIKPAPVLLDSNKDNVARVFQKIHPFVKYVGIIGCNSEQVLSDVLKEREDLDYYVPRKKVIAQFGLRYAIKNFRYHHYRKDNTLVPLAPIVKGPSISITRTTGNGGFYKSLKLIVGGEFLTVLPKMNPGQTKTFTINLPVKEAYSKQDLKIVFDSGQSPFDETDSIGSLSLSYQGHALWKLFAKADGTPFGTNERIYLFNHRNLGELK